MLRRLGDLQMTAHLLQRLPGGELLVVLGQLADDLIRRVPPALPCHGAADPPCPFSGIDSHNTWTTTRPHLKRRASNNNDDE
jgi:hypothetical protein